MLLFNDGYIIFNLITMYIDSAASLHYKEVLELQDRYQSRSQAAAALVQINISCQETSP